MKDHTTTGSSCIIILLFKAIRLVNIALITKVLAPSRWLGMGFLNHQQYLSWGRGGGRWQVALWHWGGVGLGESGGFKPFGFLADWCWWSASSYKCTLVRFASLWVLGEAIWMCLFPESSNESSKSRFSLSRRKQHRCFQCMMQCLHKFVLICFLVRDREWKCNYTALTMAVIPKAAYSL